MAGEWDTPDLSALLEVLRCNFDRLRAADRGQPPACGPLNRISHRLRRNTPPRVAAATSTPTTTSATTSIAPGSTPRMTYSSALFAERRQTPAKAQRAKYRRARARDRPAAPATTCWRSAAAGAASPSSPPREVGAKVTAITISPASSSSSRRQRMFQAGPGRAGRDPAAGLSRRDGPLRPHRLDRDVRGGGRALLADLFRQDARAC